MPLTAEQADALVNQLATDGAKLHEIVHGDAETVVATEGGNVDSLAKVLAWVAAQLNNELTGLASKQPLNANLTALAALVTTAFGRSLLELADDDALAAIIVPILAGAAPETLDTINEIAAALGDDPNFSTTIINLIATKLAIADTTPFTRTLLAAISAAAGRASLDASQRPGADIRDFGGIGDGATDNAAAAALAKAAVGAGGSIAFPGVAGTNYKFASGVDFSSYNLIVAPGVIFSGAIDITKDMHVDRTTKVAFNNGAGRSYDIYESSDFGRHAAERIPILSEADVDTSSYIGLDCTTLTPLSFSTAGDAFTADVPTSVTADKVSYTLTNVATWRGLFKAITGGEELNAKFAAAGNVAAVIRTDAGYEMISSLYSGGALTRSVKATGVAVASATAPGVSLSANLHYAPANSVWSIRIYDARTYSILFNGVEVTAPMTTAGDIREAGFACQYQAAAPTAAYVSYWSRARREIAGGKPSLKALLIGDSRTADDYGKILPYLRDYLDGACGLRADILNNYAVSGATAADQLATLTSLGVPAGTNLAVVDIGTNDINQGVALATTLANVQSILTALAGIPTVVCIPYLYYPPSIGVATGFTNGHYETGSEFRAALIKLAVANGAKVLDFTQVLGPILPSYLANPSVLDPILQDNLHPTAFARKRIAFAMARAMLGAYKVRMSPEVDRQLLPNIWQNGWSSYAGNYARYSVSRDRRVNMNGIIQAGTITAGTVMGTLPKNLWPSSDVAFFGYSSAGFTAGFSMCTIKSTTGEITLVTPQASVGFIWLSGIFYQL